MDKSNDVEFMHKYLYYAMTFEKYVYTWEKALSYCNNMLLDIKNQKIKYNRVLNEKKEVLNELDEEFKDRLDYFLKEANKAKRKSLIKLTIFLIIVFGVSAIRGILNHSWMDAVVTLALFIMGLGSFLFLPFFGNISDYIDSKKRAKQLKKEYSDENKNKQKTQLVNYIDKYSNMISSIEYRENLIFKEKKELESALAFAKKKLNDIYSINVLGSRYRNLSAVATMYQYLENGRCIQIKGHGGIYDTFDYEVTLGVIISNLRDINSKLDTVIDNQYMLYSAIKEAQNTAESIRKDMTSLGQSISSIKTNTAASATYQKQTAESARFMADMMYSKM